MRENNKKLITILIICSLTLGIISFGNQSLKFTEQVIEKDVAQPKTANTNLKIAILDSDVDPSYQWGALFNDYLTIFNGLDSSGLEAIVVTNAEIVADILLSMDVLVLIDNLPSDAASPVVKDWALKGGGILSFDSSIEFLNWAGLIPPESVGLNGWLNYWSYSSPSYGLVINDAHPVMNGYTYGDNISGTEDDSQYDSGAIMKTSAGPYYTPLVKDDLGSNNDLVVALDAPYCGRIVHIWDQKHWNTTSNRQMILNSINWIRDKFFDVPQTIVINEIHAGDPDYIELYNFGSSKNMTGWYMDFYYNNVFLHNYTFPDEWMFNSHQVVILYETSGTDTSTELYSGTSLPWISSAIAVGLFDDTGTNIDWIQTYDHILSLPADAQWINDTILDINDDFAYRTKDIDTNRASDWVTAGSGTIGSLNPDQKGYFFDFKTISGPVAIFQDGDPWGYNSTASILENYSISYTIYDSLDMGTVDLSPYQKVIISSYQSQTFYDRLNGNVSWFESYAANGGVLEIHACDSTFGAHWHGLYLMPGGLDITSLTLEAVDINLVQHPIILNPHTVDDVILDGWGNSAHGYFDIYPSDSREILQYTTTSDPILLEFEYEEGYIIATMQTLEYAYYWELAGSEVLENIILHDPSSTYFSDSLSVTTPDSLSSWQTGSSHNIEWTTTGNVSNVKIELFNSGVFEMEITANISNQGEFYWTIPLSLNDSTQFQIKVTDASNSLTYDYSEYFEIYNPTITVTSPDSASSWQRGTEHFVNWTSTGNLTNVKIDLFLNDTYVIEIVASTPNDGNYSWSIPTNLTTSTLYKIKISDASNLLVYDFSNNFEIFAPSGGRIPGYNLAILLVSIVAVSTVLLKKKFKIK